jgi:hypothetical protein
LTVDLHNGGVQAGSVLQFGDASQQAIITGPTTVLDQNAQRLIIQGPRGNGLNSEGGDVYFWAGDADANGGDIKIYAGDADNVTTGSGGYINIDAGNGYDYGGDLTLSAGGSTLNGGDISLYAGYASGGTSGIIQLSSNDNTWSFGSNGNLTLPGGGIITDSVETVIISGAGTSAVNQTYRKISSGQYIGQTDNVYLIDPPEAPSTTYKLRSAFDAGGLYESEDLVTWTIVAGAGGGAAPVPTGVIVAQHITVTVDSSDWRFDSTGNLTLPAGGTINYSDGSNALVGGGGVTDLIANGSANLTISSDGTLVLSHPDEPVYHPLDTQLVIEKAAGNYHIISGAYGLSLQATPVLGGYGDLTNNNYVDIFHDGISINVNDNTWGFDLVGNLTLPNGVSIISSNTAIMGLNIVIENMSYTGSGYPIVYLPYSWFDNTPSIEIIGGVGTQAVNSMNQWAIVTGVYDEPDVGLTFALDRSLVITDTMRFYSQVADPTASTTLLVGDQSWQLDANGNLTMPLVTRMNSGGIGAVRSAEFGTVVNAEAPGVINTSNIYMSAGTGEARIMSDANGNTLTYFGVEDPGFAGFVSMDAGVTSQYAVGLDANSNIILGATQPSGTVTTTMYTTSIGAINSDYNINGLYADSTSTVVSGLSNVKIQTGGGNVWTFGADGNTVFPTNISIDYSGGNDQFPRIIADSGKAFSVQGQGESGSAALAWTVDPNAASQYAQIGVTKAGGDNLAKVVLQAQSDSGNVATAKTWRFDETGNLTLPPGGNINAAPTVDYGDGNSIVLTAGSTTGCVHVGGSIILNAGSGGASSGIERGGNILLNTNSGTWAFGNDGNLIFPTGNLIITPDSASLGNAAVISSADHNLIALSTGVNGGTSSLWVEDYANIGTSNVAAVYSNPVPGSKIVRIAVGQNGGAGPKLWDFDNTGNLTLPDGGQIVSAANTGNVVINASDGTPRSWTFEGSGNLTLPVGGTINYSDGSNALVGGTTSPPNYAALAQSVVVTPPTFGNGGAGQLRVDVNAIVVSSNVTVSNVGFMITALGTGSGGVGLLGEGTATAGVQTITLNGAFSNDQTYYVSAFVTSQLGTTWSEVYLATSGICLIAGTMITLADGTKKAIENITYSDTLLAWDFDQGKFTTAKPLWIKQGETGGAHNRLTFSDGTVLRTFDQHRIFNKQWGAFTYPMTDNTPLGTLTFNEHGDEVMLVNKEQVFGRVEYYNVITDRHINLFSDSILTSCRLNNAYPIVDMQFNKSGRTLRDASEFVGIDARWIAGLRLCEQTYSVDDMRWYVARLERLDIAQLDSDQSAAA